MDARGGAVRSTRPHWLTGVAGRLVDGSGSHLDIGAETGIAEAWRAVCEATGLTEENLARLISETFRVGLADLASAAPTATRLLPPELARRYNVLPLEDVDRQVVVATADPTDLDAEQAIGFASGRSTVLRIAPPTALQEAIDAAYAPDRAIQSILKTVDGGRGEGVQLLDEDDPRSPQLDEDELGGPVVKLANIIFHEADRLGSSDVHIQPTPAGGVVRFRVDGVLRPGLQMPLTVLQRVVSRIKIMARLDIADRLRPQDGRARIVVDGRRYDLRISTVPTQGLEKAVIRLLPAGREFSLQDVGMHEDELRAFHSLMNHREGIVLVTGPTGSGKTTTLYAALREIATEDVNVMTVEDPVEYQLPGLTQIQVEQRQNVTFASALRAILRQDPDVIFVGEIRDPETAHMAAQASLTGHLVLSTLHTNDATGAVRRLADLGLDLATIADTLRGVVAQRLVRMACPSCSTQVAGRLDAQRRRLQKRYGVRPQVEVQGCEACGETGYRGRLPLMEIFEATPSVQELIARGATHVELFAAARNVGMQTLRAAGVRRVAAGGTTLEEVERVLGDLAVESDAGDGAPPELASGPSFRPPDGTTPLDGLGAEPGDRPPHVLVVDDDPASRLLSAALLERAGYRVTEADDGASALALLSGVHDYSLAVLDLDMPGMNGREVLVSIRSAPGTATLPVLVLTGSPDPEADIELMELGADDYLRKPLDPYRLLTRVRATLRRLAWHTAANR